MKLNRPTLLRSIRFHNWNIRIRLVSTGKIYGESRGRKGPFDCLIKTDVTFTFSHFVSSFTPFPCLIDIHTHCNLGLVVQQIATESDLHIAPEMVIVEKFHTFGVRNVNGLRLGRFHATESEMEEKMKMKFNWTTQKGFLGLPSKCFSLLFSHHSKRTWTTSRIITNVGGGKLIDWIKQNKKVARREKFSPHKREKHKAQKEFYFFGNSNRQINQTKAENSEEKDFLYYFIFSSCDVLINFRGVSGCFFITGGCRYRKSMEVQYENWIISNSTQK